MDRAVPPAKTTAVEGVLPAVIEVLNKDRAKTVDGRERRTSDRPSGTPPSDQPRHMLPTIKLGSYDGSSALETFLAKFENFAAYYSWSVRDRLFHMKSSLKVMQAKSYGSSPTMRPRLTSLNCFVTGNVNQVKRFRAEPRNRCRRSGESIQSVYKDIRRLMALGFPSQSRELCEVIGRDFFLESSSTQLYVSES